MIIIGGLLCLTIFIFGLYHKAGKLMAEMGITIFAILSIGTICIFSFSDRKITSKEEDSVQIYSLCAMKDVSSYEEKIYIFSGKLEEISKIKFVVDTEYGKQIKEAKLGENDYILEDDNQAPCVLKYYEKIEYEPFSKWEKFLTWPYDIEPKTETNYLRTVYVIPKGALGTGDYSLDLQ